MLNRTKLTLDETDMPNNAPKQIQTLQAIIDQMAETSKPSKSVKPTQKTNTRNPHKKTDSQPNNHQANNHHQKNKSVQAKQSAKKMSEKKLRSTAFSLLARREHSQSELRKKLIDYGADAEEVDKLLVEFIEKNYQSDGRTNQALFRQNIRQGKGIKRLEQSLKKHGLQEDEQLTALIAETNWLEQAIKQRIKKFGETLPTLPKEKARQLRFLQYKGYDIGICYQAIKTNDFDF